MRKNCMNSSSLAARQFDVVHRPSSWPRAVHAAQGGRGHLRRGDRAASSAGALGGRPDQGHIQPIGGRHSARARDALGGAVPDGSWQKKCGIGELHKSDEDAASVLAGEFDLRPQQQGPAAGGVGEWLDHRNLVRLSILTLATPRQREQERSVAPIPTQGRRSLPRIAEGAEPTLPSASRPGATDSGMEDARAAVRRGDQALSTTLCT